ncbi:TIGR03915 family putative DNA repair protein [Geomonas sp. RF6]|uniref:TIGR03915 family putative DNA repair protein n=1 Tax=Geomonas sp. RF6 TaxID=2897342 RepID=UPI001E349A4B|nr:TIGR03915 family putative DNA repair protein [Geomonas sp. RF6]UFS72263.1 TIGR03915 family putative DNA repair protein [Geomonas sp. RF6]
MTTRYLYDGSFAGFICAVAHSLEGGVEPDGFEREGDQCQGGLFAELRHPVAADEDTVRRFRKRFQSAVSPQAYETVRYAFHSEKGDVEMLLWSYLRLGLTLGRRLDGMLAEEPVYSVRRLARQVAREAHRFLGLLRFREVICTGCTFLYARFEPDADLLEFVAPHFADRIGDRPWMIHDLRRNKAVLWDPDHGLRPVREVSLVAAPVTSSDEENIARYWRGYFQHLAIEERSNLSLQQQHVPLKYRKHLVEFEAVKNCESREP